MIRSLTAPALAAAVTALPGLAVPCTRALYHGADGLVITGRTTDWKSEMVSNLYIRPEGTARDGAAGPLANGWSDTSRRTLPIAGKAISSLITYNGVGDLYRIWAVANRSGAEYNVAAIGNDFTTPHKVDFAQDSMRAVCIRPEEERYRLSVA